MASRGEEVPLVNYKTKMKQNFGRTTSCVSNPQLSAMDALKDANLQLLCDLLNVDGGDAVVHVNQPYEEERQKTLLHVASELGDADAVKILLSFGADPNSTHKKNGQTALHFAVTKRVHSAVFRILLTAGANVNAKASGGKTVLHALARKCLASDAEEGASALSCLRMVTAARGVEVDAEDEAGGRTPLYLVASGDSVHGNYVSAIDALLAAGADWSLECGEDESIRETIKSKVSKFAFLGLEKTADASFGMSGQSIGSAIKQSLITMIEEAELREETDGDDDKHMETFKKTLDDAVLSDLEAQSPGEFGLIQRAADAGLHRYVLALLEKGLNPNLFMDGTTPSVILAARRGHCGVLRVLKETDAGIKTDFAVVDPCTHWTVLHNILRKPFSKEQMTLQYDTAEMERRYLKCLHLLLAEDGDERDPFEQQLRRVINCRDDCGNTALHYATQLWPQTVVRQLLERGANVGVKNAFSEVPVEAILPSTMEDFLNEFCLRSVGDPTNKDFNVTIRYDFLAPPREGEDHLVPVSNGSRRKRREGWASSNSRGDGVNAGNQGGEESGPKQQQREKPPKGDDIEAKIMADNEGAAAASSSSPPLPETEVIWHMSQSEKHRHLMKHPVITSFLWLKWKRIGAAYNKNLVFYVTFVACLTAFIFLTLDGNSGDFAKCKDEAVVKVLWFANVILLAILFLRECVQFGIAPRRYFFSIENCLEVVLIGLTCFLLATYCEAGHLRAGRHVAAVTLVLAWSEWITIVGRHPRLSAFNIYVTMFYKVTTTFIFFLIWYSFFIFAFALGFYILLHKKESDAEADDYPFFNTLGLSIIKTFTMFVGELEFGDLPIDTGAGYVFFLAFIFLIVVVMMNLLNGLAVSDTGVIREQAETNLYVTQVEVISYVESMLLGDPFNLLSNWPAFVWLRRVPACSLGSVLYRVPPLRYIFHKMTGAPKVLLFYDFLPKKKITLFPNAQPAFCGCLGGDDDDDGDDRYRKRMAGLPRFPREILESIKSCVLEKERSRDSAEERLARAEEATRELAEEVRKLSSNIAKMADNLKK